MIEKTRWTDTRQDNRGILPKMSQVDVNSRFEMDIPRVVTGLV